MSDINKVTLTGRVAREPETHYTESGRAVVNFTVAVSYDNKNSQTNNRPAPAVPEGQGSSLPWRDMVATNNRPMKGDVSFLDVVVLGKLAEGCSQHLKKGRKVLVEGRLQQRKGIQVLAHQVYYLTSLYEGVKREPQGLPQGVPQEDIYDKSGEEIED